MRRLVVVGVWLAACGGGQTPWDFALAMDASVPTDAAVRSTIGGPCMINDDCSEGRSPTCFRQTLLNIGGGPATRDGYCSSPCKEDADCPDGSVCYEFNQTQSWCMKSCLKASQCRSPGYACLVGWEFCYPNGYLDCDPTEAQGRCGTAPRTGSGACRRRAYGAGNTGECVDICSIGGTCSLNSQCGVVDATDYTDPVAGKPDGFKGPVCLSKSGMLGAGADCVYINECVEGLQCDVVPPDGDSTCRKLCSNGPGVDGGVTCPPGQSCYDAWGLLGSATPAGLCR